MQRTTEERFWEKVDRRGPNDCWEWTAGKKGIGYGRIRILGKLNLSHRYSYQLHKGEIPEGLCVLHSCHNPSCVNPNHLRVGTQQDNMDDMKKAGRGVSLKGEESGNSLLTEPEAKAIIEMLNRFPPTKSNCGPTSGINKFLGHWFGVSHKTISHINTGRKWKHLDRGAA